LNVYNSIANGTISRPLSVECVPPGSSRSGDGTGISFYIGTNGGNRREQARIDVVQNYFSVRPSFSIETIDYNSPYTTFYSRLFIDPRGNIGIGTKTPSSVLAIKADSSWRALSIGDGGGSGTNDQFLVFGDGFVVCRDIQVMNGTLTHPDYVFNKEYKLMPLAELETFITKNKHLPNVISAEEVKKEGGMTLGKMQNQTLEKTEELFLYVIEINKKLELLAQENEQLKLRLQKVEGK
jgi:hypothetical protein